MTKTCFHPADCWQTHSDPRFPDGDFGYCAWCAEIAGLRKALDKLKQQLKDLQYEMRYRLKDIGKAVVGKSSEVIILATAAIAVLDEEGGEMTNPTWTTVIEGDTIKTSKERPIKLNLGCGSTYLQGYVNIDRSSQNANTRMDVDKLRFPDGGVDEIYSSHLVEHLPYHKFLRALIEWRRVLKVGGSLIIRCPNIEVVLRNWLEASYEARFGESNHGVSPILGFQDRGWGHIHRNVFTVRRLEDLVAKAGFEVASCETIMNRYGNSPNGDILLRARRGERC